MTARIDGTCVINANQLKYLVYARLCAGAHGHAREWYVLLCIGHAREWYVLLCIEHMSSTMRTCVHFVTGVL